jgi:hypothetical protein
MRRLSLETAVSLAQLVSAFVLVFTLLYAVSEWKRTVDYTTQDLEYNLYGRLLEMDLVLTRADQPGLLGVVQRLPPFSSKVTVVTAPSSPLHAAGPSS